MLVDRKHTSCYRLSRVSVRGILIVTHDEITRTQVEALNSTLWLLTRTVPDNHSPEDRKGVERIDQGSSAATVEYESRLERTGRRRAQGRRPPPDARMGTRAFNAPVAFSPNTPVTGSVIGNRHPSRHSFCSLPHQTTQSVSGHREQGWNV